MGQLKLVHSSIPGATESDQLRISMAWKTTITLLTFILPKVAIYTSIATISFLAVSLALALVLGIFHGTTSIT